MSGESASRAANFLHQTSEFLFFVIVLSLPWELFQRIPSITVTLTKAASALFIVCAIAQRILERNWTFRRTGLELPLVAFAALCALSVMTTIDRKLTQYLLILYAQYLVLFYAVVWHVSSAAQAKRLLLLFSLSSAGVGVLAIACRLGMLYPTLVTTYVPLGVRATPDTWDAIATRMVPAGEDYNQSVLAPLLAFVTCTVAIFCKTSLPRDAAILGTILLGSFAAIGVALSRSSIALCVAAVIAMALLTALRPERRSSAVRNSAFVIVALLTISAIAMPDVLQRFTLIGGTRDPSLEGRMATYRAAVALVPRHLVFGSGLGTGDAAIAASEFSAQAKGVVIHNLPLRFLLELGLAGLAAYLWLWFALFQRLGSRVTNCSEDERLHRNQHLAIFIAVFLVTMLMPFSALSLYPVLLGVAFGPIVNTGHAMTIIGTRRLLIPAAILVGLVVIANILAFQFLARRADAWCDLMHRASQAEQEGRFAAAEKLYHQALDKDPTHGKSPMWNRALAVFDYPFIVRQMHVTRAQLDSVAAACFGVGRANLMQGNGSEAASYLSVATKQDPRFAQAIDNLGDLEWVQGAFAESIEYYEQAVSQSQLPGNEAMRSIVELRSAQIAVLLANGDVPSKLFAARLLRRNGQWTKATQIYADVLAADSENADALFHLGIAAEIEGRAEEAHRMYEKSLLAAPDHLGAALRLKRITVPEQDPNVETVPKAMLP
ncbi:MAG: tetratricopeptide repeat protein [Candidatus Hydrogenedentes bacterium]|nr:tetratricopeptide repeat protein [Candidatus Hydrogenedentota bacterium]